MDHSLHASNNGYDPTRDTSTGQNGGSSGDRQTIGWRDSLPMDYGFLHENGTNGTHGNKSQKYDGQQTESGFSAGGSTERDYDIFFNGDHEAFLQKMKES